MDEIDNLFEGFEEQEPENQGGSWLNQANMISLIALGLVVTIQLTSLILPKSIRNKRF